MEGDVLALGCSPRLGLCHISTTGWTPAQPPNVNGERGWTPAWKGSWEPDGEKAEGGEEEGHSRFGLWEQTQGDTGAGWVKDKLGGGLKVLKCQPEECRPGPGWSTEPGSASRQHGWMESLGRTNQPTICIQRWCRRMCPQGKNQTLGRVEDAGKGRRGGA